MIARLSASLAYWRRFAHRHAFIFGRGFTFRRFFNFLLVLLGERLRLARAPGLPWSLFVDPVNRCILHCPLCGTGCGQKPREHMQLAYDDFIRYVAPLVNVLYVVKLYNYGEPFLNPALPRMVRYLHDRRIITQVNSNLNLLSAQQADEIVAAGLDTLVVSFDGLSQEVYQAYRKGGDVARVKENIAKINEAKQRAGSATPRVLLQFLITRHNEHEYGAVRDYAASVGAVFFPQPITLDVTNNAQCDEWLPQNEDFTHYDRLRHIKKKSRPDRACGFLWNDAVINVDGGVSPCCHLFYKETDYGDLRREPFSAIWNNAAFVASRRIFRERRLSGTATACHRCLDVRAFSTMDVDLINENRTNNLR